MITDAYLTNAPDWYADWARAVHSRGGICTRAPESAHLTYFGIDQTGALAERYPDGSGGYRYELAPTYVRLMDASDTFAADALLQFEAGFDMAGGMDAINASAQILPGMVTTATRAVGSVFGAFPWWAWLVAGVVGYGALVQAGIVPPFNKLLKE